ncbi:MAG TPA: GAF domain-containing protein [Allosphingosinicella sp.]
MTDRLRTRLARAGDLRGELDAFRELSVLTARDPRSAVQRFLELAIELCPAAGSAGLSELERSEDGEELFRWTALAGEYAPYAGGTTPRDFSPCGLCLAQGTTVLVERPARVFTYFEAAHVPIVEGLIVPLHDANGEPLGTLWVTSHSDKVRGFDSTDARVMERLAAQLLLSMKLQRLNRRVEAVAATAAA